MIATNYAKVGLLCLLLCGTLLVNIDDNLLARLGLTGNYGLALAIALLIAMLAAGRKLPFILLIVMLSLIANMPEGFALNFGIGREVYFGLMVSLVLAPYIGQVFDL